MQYSNNTIPGNTNPQVRIELTISSSARVAQKSRRLWRGTRPRPGLAAWRRAGSRRPPKSPRRKLRPRRRRRRSERVILCAAQLRLSNNQIQKRPRRRRRPSLESATGPTPLTVTVCVVKGRVGGASEHVCCLRGHTITSNSSSICSRAGLVCAETR